MEPQHSVWHATGNSGRGLARQQGNGTPVLIPISGLLQEFEPYLADKENYVIVNVPPNYMFQAKVQRSLP